MINGATVWKMCKVARLVDEKGSVVILKNNVPRVSANPNPFPAMLKGWQGNPARSMSWSGMSAGAMSLMSPNGFS